MSYLDAITLTKALPCLAEPGRTIVVGKPSRPLDEALPYLAALPDVIAYNPEARTLTFRRQRGFLTLYVDRVYITQVRDPAEGLELLEALVGAINATWDHRGELTPVSEPHRAPQLLDIWSLLPRTNCTQCGESTCMAFAAALLRRARKADACLPLKESTALAEQRATLQALL